MTDRIEVAIFSFNRGDYLKNCVDSVQQNLPQATIKVYDDNSDCPKTVAYLETLKGRVYYSGQNGESRHGNLYSNMEMALSQCARPYILLLQDDCQMIRPLDARDTAVIQHAFSDPDIGFLRPQLMKSGDQPRWERELVPDAKNRLYTPIDTYTSSGYGNAYNDVVLADVETLRRIGWEFSESERANQIQAQQNLKAMPFMADGFVFYCPEVPSYRNRKLYWASKLVQNRLKGKISAFKTLTDAENKNLKERSLDIWPVAEDFLTPTIPSVQKPFLFQDYKKTRWLRFLYKVERALLQPVFLLKHLTKSR